MSFPPTFTENRLRRPTNVTERELRLESLDLTGARLLCGTRLFVLVSGRILQHDPSTHDITGTLSVISNAQLARLASRARLRLGQLEFEIDMIQSRLAELRGEQSVRFTGRLAEIKPIY